METKFKIGDVVRYVHHDKTYEYKNFIGIITHAYVYGSNDGSYTVKWVDHKEHPSRYVNSQLEKLDTEMAKILYLDEK